VSWGSNINQLPAQLPLEVQQRGAVKALQAGETFSVALLSNGSLVLWGDYDWLRVPAQVIAGPLAAVAASETGNNLAVVFTNGSLWCNSWIADKCRNAVPSGSKVSNVRLSDYAVFVLLEGGTWGVADGLDSPNWQPTNLTDNPAIEPLTAKFGREVPGNWLVSSDPSSETQELVADLRRANVTAVEGCGDKSVLLSNGSILMSFIVSSEIRQPDGMEGQVGGMACGWNTYILLLSNGSAVAWGLFPDPLQPPPLPSKRRITAAAVGYKHSLFLLDDGVVVQSGELSTYGPPVPAAAANQPLLDIAAGDGIAVVKTRAGRIISWGLRSNGVAETDIPKAVRSSNITAIAAGDGFAMALSSAGRVYMWGSVWGRLPPQYENLTGVLAFASAASSIGGNHALALLGNGSLVWWGASGRCVVGDPLDYSGGIVSLPWLVGANITGIGLSGESVVAVLSNGSLLHWGCDWQSSSWLGQLDVPEGARNGVAEAAAGYGYTMARTTANKLVIWGNSSVVDNTPSSLLGPDALNITSIGTSYSRAFALLANGSLVTWGQYVDRDMPDSVRWGRVVRFSAGDGFTLALVEPYTTPTPSLPSPTGAGGVEGSSILRCGHVIRSVRVCGGGCTHAREPAEPPSCTTPAFASCPDSPP
jgi:alpha-tubulin suppressor-like RCC1 family protein